jgi:exosome complex component MTR3
MNKTSSQINGPDDSWDPLTLLDQKQLTDLIKSKKGVNVPSEKLPKDKILLKVDCLSEAAGSSYIEMGNTKILAIIYGPREIPRKDNYDFKVANLNCEFRFSSFSCFMQRRGTLSQRDQSLDEKNFSSIIEETLKPSILLHKYPKSQIDLYILCIENDLDSKYVLSSSIISASMALANASIELYDMVSSYTYLPSCLTLSYMPQLNQITSIYFSNQNLENDFFISTDLFKSNIKDSIENCKKIYAYMRLLLSGGTLPF